MPFFKSKNTPLQERIDNERERSALRLAKARDKFDVKNAKKQLIGEYRLQEIRDTTDIQIESKRIEIAENYDIKHHPDLEFTTMTTHIANETIAVNHAIKEANFARLDAKYEESRDASRIRLLALKAATRTTKLAFTRNLYLINAHNRGVWNEFKDTIHGIDSQIDNTSEMLLQDPPGTPKFNYALSDPSLITQDNFDKIHEGMPLSEVVALLGSDGNILSQDDIVSLFGDNATVSGNLRFVRESIQRNERDYNRDLDVRVWTAPLPEQKSKTAGLMNVVALSVIFRDNAVVGKYGDDLKKNRNH